MIHWTFHTSTWSVSSPFYLVVLVAFLFMAAKVEFMRRLLTAKFGRSRDVGHYWCLWSGTVMFWFWMLVRAYSIRIGWPAKKI
ncbi:hypothetical protein DSUL_20262 [Desulfovibrionales bacterium]